MTEYLQILQPSLQPPEGAVFRGAVSAAVRTSQPHTLSGCCCRLEQALSGTAVKVDSVQPSLCLTALSGLVGPNIGVLLQSRN